jgi:hypothetical protein
MLLFDGTFEAESNERPKLHQKPLIEEISWRHTNKYIIDY